jgi:hypothetical protein
MTTDFRAQALAGAIQVDSANGAKAVVDTANKFLAFLEGKTAGAPVSAPAKEATPPAATKTAVAPVKDAKPAAEKPAAKAAAKPSAPKKDEVDPDAKKMVGDKVNELLKANLREEVVALLASFGEATSATGIVKQGDEVIGAFMEQADALLTAAAEVGSSLAD